MNSQTEVVANEPSRLAFDALVNRYNFQNTPPRRQMFTELVIEELRRLPKPNRVLDIGCGRGIGRQVKWTWMIREHVNEFWGIDPDSEVVVESGLFDQYQSAMMEDAELPENSFDLAYSYMVMEHVSDPEEFLRAVYRCLKSGGQYMFITPNGMHYFGLITRICNAVKIDEIMLRIAKGDSGMGYHYPVHYRSNTPRDIGRVAEKVGFERSEYAFVEEQGPTGYLRGPLRLMLHAGNAKRRLLPQSKCLLNLVVRLTK